MNPIDRLANETEAVLGAGLSAEERAEFRRVLDTHRQTGDGRAVIVGALTDVAGEEPANQNVDWGPLGKAIAAASRDAPEKARALAERWAAIDATETTDIVTAPSLLLGLARLIARDDVNVEGFQEDDLLALTLVESERADTVGDTFQVDASLPERLHHFLWDKVRDALVFDTGEDDEDDDQALELMSFVVARRGSGRSQKLGTIRLEWLAHERRVRRDVGEVLRWRRVEWTADGRAPGGSRLLQPILMRGRCTRQVGSRSWTPHGLHIRTRSGERHTAGRRPRKYSNSSHLPPLQLAHGSTRGPT